MAIEFTSKKSIAVQREDEVPMVGRVDWWELQSCVNFPWRKSSDGFIGSSLSFIYPICSMYSIFTYIWVIYGVNVGKYSIHGAYGYMIFIDVFFHGLNYSVHLHRNQWPLSAWQVLFGGCIMVPSSNDWCARSIVEFSKPCDLAKL